MIASDNFRWKKTREYWLVKKPWQNMEFSAERYIPRFTSVVFQAPEMVTSPMSYFWLVVLDGGAGMTNFLYLSYIDDAKSQ